MLTDKRLLTEASLDNLIDVFRDDEQFSDRDKREIAAAVFARLANEIEDSNNSTRMDIAYAVAGLMGMEINYIKRLPETDQLNQILTQAGQLEDEACGRGTLKEWNEFVRPLREFK